MAHVERRGDRRWRARYRTPAGGERSRTFDRKTDAERWLAGIETAKVRGEWVDPKLGKITFGEWVDRWRSTRTGLRPSTIARDDSYIRNHVLPAFGTVPLAKIDHLAVQGWVADLEAKGLAPATVQKCHQIAGKIMASAVVSGLVPSSPFSATSLPAIERVEMRFLMPGEVATLADAVDPRYRAMILLGAYGGLRAGEMLGLRRGRLDLLRGEVEVAEILVEVRGKIHYGPPKTSAGRRRVPLPRPVVEGLQVHAAGLEPGELVFTAPEGGPLRLSLFRRRVWAPAIKAAGVEPLRLHDLRHTAVAFWIAAGASPNEVARRAGHRSVVTVLDRYGHLLPGTEVAVTEKLEAMMEAAAPSPDGQILPFPKS